MLSLGLRLGDRSGGRSGGGHRGCPGGRGSLDRLSDRGGGNNSRHLLVECLAQGLDVLGHGVPICETQHWGGVGRSSDDLVETGINILDLGGRDIGFFRDPASQKLVEDYTGGEDIRAGVDRPWILDHFRGGVVGGAENDALALALIGEAGQSEVADLGPFLAVQEDVGRLDVAVQDARLMGVGETFADAGHQAGDFVLFNGLAVGGVVERLPVHELHHDIGHVVDFTEIVDADEVRVVEHGHGLGLVLEPPTEVLVLTKFARENLDCHVPLKGLLASLVDCAHSPLRDEGQNIVGRQKFVKFLGARGLELRREGHYGWCCAEVLRRARLVKKMCLNP